ncbi:MAG: septum formation initiator family protein [Candidatus Buchananbacteria bacterium]
MIGSPHHYNQPKNKGKKIIVSLILIIVVIFLAFNLVSTWQKNHEINQEIDGLQTQISTIQTDNLKLNELIGYFNSNAYIEEKARVDLGFKKEGEKVVMVPESMKNDLLAQEKNAAGEKNLEELSNPKKWWRYFFK